MATATGVATLSSRDAATVNIPGVCELICLLIGGGDAPKGEAEKVAGRRGRRRKSGKKNPLVANEAKIPVIDGRQHLGRKRERKVLRSCISHGGFQCKLFLLCI